jgi:tripartite-type tricarboxylate transporter receptor subunit TctC
MKRRRFLQGAAATGAAAAHAPALLAQGADQQPIRIIFPFAAGGVGDALARMMSEALQKTTGRSLIVESRTGGAGRPGVQAAKAAEPNGSTLLFTPVAPMSIYPHFYNPLGYDPFADFEPLSQHATFEFALAVAARVPAKNLKELVAWLKANPSEASFGSPAIGTLPYFTGWQFGKLAGIDLRHVSYRGSAAGMIDLVAGQVPMFITSTGEFVQHDKDGRVRVIATSEKQPFLPGIETFEEAGYKLRGNGWYAMYAPAKTPVALLDQYSKALAAAAKEPGNRARLLALGLQPTGTTREELRAIQKRDMEMWAPIIKASGFRPKQ